MKNAEHRLHGPDWLRVAATLLDGRPDACALLDRAGRIVAVNGAFAALVDVSAADLGGRSWAEACGVEGTRGGAAADVPGNAVVPDEWVARTSEGVALRLSVQIAPIAETPVVLVSVIRWCVADHQAAAAGSRSYEVDRIPFGTLRWAQPVDGRVVELDQPCYRALHGREAPCAHCPARSIIRPGGTRVGVIVSGAGEPEIIAAQSVARDAIRLTARRVDEALFSELVEAKLAEHAGRASLTQRELEVLHLLTLGRAPADVARALGFSVSTAKFHVHNVLRKLGAESRVDLLRVLVHGSAEPSEGPASESRRRVEIAEAAGNRGGGGVGHGRKPKGRRARSRARRRVARRRPRR